jgi:hypothetical protein
VTTIGPVQSILDSRSAGAVLRNATEDQVRKAVEAINAMESTVSCAAAGHDETGWTITVHCKDESFRNSMHGILVSVGLVS